MVLARPLRGILSVLDRLLQVLVPARRDRVVWISHPDYIGNAYHLFRHAVATRRGLEHVWLVDDADVGPRIVEDFARFGGPAGGHRLDVRSRHSLGGYVAYLRSRVAFHTHGVYPWVSSAVRRECVSLWHGMPIKRIGALHSRGGNPHPTFGTRHLATSEFFRYVIAAAFRVEPDDVLVTGLPRCDVLRGPTPLAPDAGSLRRSLGVPATDRLVLWMPTYRARAGSRDRSGTRRTFVDDVGPDRWTGIDRQAARTGCTVLVKLHPFDRLNIEGHDPSLDRVRVVRWPDWRATGVELYDLLAATDGLITDISSVLVDWLPTGRPVGVVGFDPDTYTRDLVLPMSTLRDSRRVHDLDDDAALADFFDRVAAGTRVTSDEDDLSGWLYPPDIVDASEAVLRAVQL